MSQTEDGMGQWVPLSTACLRLKKSRGQAYRLVLIGKLVGEKRGTEWFVTEASIADLILHKDRAS